MSTAKLGFEDFIATVGSGEQEFVTALHHDLTQLGCKLEVKEAKSGYVVSYLLNKKTVANYVSRKKGLIARIYADHIQEYMELLETLPSGMVKEIKAAAVCKRLVNPEDCNPKCAKGYDFLLDGERLQRCRYGAFMFLLSEENNPFIRSFLLKEAEARS